MRLIRQSAFTFFWRYYKIEKSQKEQYFAKKRERYFAETGERVGKPWKRAEKISFGMRWEAWSMPLLP